MPSERLRAACKEAFRIGKIDEKERKRLIASIAKA
jgi:hypothetical protein